MEAEEGTKGAAPALKLPAELMGGTKFELVEAFPFVLELLACPPGTKGGALILNASADGFSSFLEEGTPLLEARPDMSYSCYGTMCLVPTGCQATDSVHHLHPKWQRARANWEGKVPEGDHAYGKESGIVRKP